MHTVGCWYGMAGQAPSGQKHGVVFGRVSTLLLHELKGRQGELFSTGWCKFI